MAVILGGKPVIILSAPGESQNGYGDMVIMSIETYEKNLFLNDVHGKLAAAEKQIAQGKVLDGESSLKGIR